MSLAQLRSGQVASLVSGPAPHRVHHCVSPLVGDRQQRSYLTGSMGSSGQVAFPVSSPAPHRVHHCVSPLLGDRQQRPYLTGSMGRSGQVAFPVRSPAPHRVHHCVSPLLGDRQQRSYLTGSMGGFGTVIHITIDYRGGNSALKELQCLIIVTRTTVAINIEYTLHTHIAYMQDLEHVVSYVFGGLTM